MLNKKKFLIRTAAVLLGIICLFILLIIMALSHSTGQFNKYAREHTNAQKIVAEAIRPALEWAPTTSTQTAAPPSVPTKPIDLELRSLFDDFYGGDKSLRKIPSPFVLRRTFSRFLFEDFPEEGKTGPIPCGPALRRRILEDVAMSEAGWKLLHEQRTTSDTVTSASIARLQPLLDRTDRIMSRTDWPLTDITIDTAGDGVRFSTEFLTQLALYRARVRGRQELAGRMLVNLVRLNVLTMSNNFARFRNKNILGISADRMIWSMIDNDLPGAQAGLEEAAAILARARLSDQQVDELRAARAMSAADYFSHTIPGSPADHLPPDTLEGKWMRLIDPPARAIAWAILCPSARSWAEGDAKEFFAAQTRLAALSKITYAISGDRLDSMAEQIFSTDSSSFGGEHPFNTKIDQLQMIVAIGRYRQANGNYPDSIDQIVPRYISRSSLGKAVAYGVARIPAGVYPARSVNPIERGNYFDGAINRYRKQFGRLPQSAGELRAFDSDERLSDSQTRFTYLAERPVIYTVRRESIYRAQLEIWRDRARDEQIRSLYENSLAEIKQGNDRLDYLLMEALCPERESAHPEIIELLK